MDPDQIIVRDSIIFAVALLFVAGGVADAVHILTGLPWWGAAPLGVALWGTAAALLYRRVQQQLSDPPNETVS
jgi:hypothetical protein